MRLIFVTAGVFIYVHLSISSSCFTILWSSYYVKSLTELVITLCLKTAKKSVSLPVLDELETSQREKRHNFFSTHSYFKHHRQFKRNIRTTRTLLQHAEIPAFCRPELFMGMINEYFDQTSSKTIERSTHATRFASGVSQL